MQKHQMGVMFSHRSEGREAQVDLDLTYVERAMDNAYKRLQEQAAKTPSGLSPQGPAAATPPPEAPSP